MRFNKLDLNLLVALDAMLTERSVIRAAERLNLSPSATSNALSRLREYFQDELLVQVGRKMVLTPRAEQLQVNVRNLLIQVETTVSVSPEFIPSQSDRSFRIFATDYMQTVLAPYVLELVSQERCTAQINFLPIGPNAQRSIERGEADLLIASKDLVSSKHPFHLLYEEELVCLVWSKGRFAHGELSQEKFLEARYAVVKPLGGREDPFEMWYAKYLDASKHIAVTTYSLAVLPSLIEGTDYITILPLRLAQKLVMERPFTIKKAPIPTPKMDLGIQWHTYQISDQGIHWLCGLFKKASSRLCRELEIDPAFVDIFKPHYEAR